jgi:hypothetical protein
MNSHNAILQPHTTPAQIVQQMKASQADIPSELLLPTPLSATYQNVVLHIIEFYVFFTN